MDSSQCSLLAGAPLNYAGLQTHRREEERRVLKGGTYVPSTQGSVHAGPCFWWGGGGGRGGVVFLSLLEGFSVVNPAA